MKIKLGLRFKMTLLLILAAGILLAVLYQQFDRTYQKSVMNKYVDIASGVASLSATVLDGDITEQYFNMDKPDENYYKWQERLQSIKSANGVDFLYAFRLDEDKQLMRYLYDVALPGEDSNFAAFGETYPYQPADYLTAIEVMKTGQPTKGLEVTKTAIGYLASAYAPVKNSRGDVIALLGVDIDMDQIIAEKDAQLLLMMQNCGLIIAVCFLLLLLIVQMSVINPIRSLKAKVTEMADGRLGVQATVKGRNEIADISKVFNRMSKNIEGHICETEALNTAYYKFVPSQFFELLQKNSVTEICLGDQRNTKLTVLTLATDQFEEYIAKMSNEKTFAFINEVLTDCVPFVMQHNGVIERFEGAGLTAFYTEGEIRSSNEEAVESAISILQKMHRSNDGIIKEKQPGSLINVRVRFGIAYGFIKLGIVGHEQRMEAITISEQRFIAQFLSKAAAKYYASILITESAVSTIPDFHRKYHNRFLGYVYLSPQGDMEKIYDVFDGDAMDDIESKEQTKALFEQGVELFYRREFYKARMVFIEVLKQFRKDSASREYLYLCDQYYAKEPPSDLPLAIETV